MKNTMALGLVLAAGMVLAPSALAARPADVNELSMEVAALQTLRKLELSQEQLKAFADLAREMAAKTGSRKAAQTSGKYKAALGGLYDALVKGDEDKIHESQDKLDEIALTESADLDDEVSVNEEARQRAAKALQLLNARQIGSLATTLTIMDPLERLIEGLDEVRGQDSSDKDQACEDVASEVARLLAGHGTKDGLDLKGQVMAFLKKAQDLSDSSFKKDKPNLEKSARQLLGKYNPVAVLTHNVENGLSELLANPRLGAAIAALQKK